MAAQKRTEKKTKSKALFRCFLEKDLLAYKAFSFFIYGGFGALYPYLPLYFKSYGLSSLLAGTIVGIRPLIQFIGAPFWAELAERFQAKRLILCGGILAWIVKALLLWGVIPKNQSCVETYTNSSTNISYIFVKDLWQGQDPETDKIDWKIDHKKTLVEKAHVNPGLLLAGNSFLLENIVSTFDVYIKEKITFTTKVDEQEIKYLFVIFLMVIIIGEFLESPTYALSDASLLNRLGEDRDYYGQIRQWGAVGWAIATSTVGALLYATRSTMCAVLRFTYDDVFYVYFGFISCAFFCVFCFTFTKSQDEEEKPSLRRALKVLCKPIHLTFLVTILFSGCCFGFLMHFVNWYIDDKGGSTLVMGAAGAARELGEMTFFFLGGSCVKFIGNMNTMGICLLGYAACFYWFSIIKSPWMAVPLELLDGSIYGLVWCNSVNYMSSLGAPIDAVVIMQGILQGIFYGLGNGGGTVLSGHLYEAIGARTTFECFAMASLVVLLILLVTFPIFQAMEHSNEVEYESLPTTSKLDDLPDTSSGQWENTE